MWERFHAVRSLDWNQNMKKSLIVQATVPVFTKLKKPGLRKAGDLTIKQGISKDDKAVLDWVDQVKQNIIQRETMTVSLLDESGNPVQTWEAVNAWPKKLTREEKTDRIAYSFETLVIAHEGVYVK